LKKQRAEYGKQVLSGLAERLTAEYGKGWSFGLLKQCVWFANKYPDEQISYTLCNKLTWSHIRLLLPIDDELKRDFYIEVCSLEHWSVRTLRERLDSMLYERTAISRKPEKTIRRELDDLKQDKKLTPDLVFRDPYFLDFLGLQETYSEKDLEQAIILEMQKFILEASSDMAFLARQKRIVVDDTDYSLDLLFFHRRLRRLVAIDLKLGRFKAEYKGQMELYLRWLEENEMCPGEEKPIGLILCEGKNEEHIRLLQLDNANIRVAEYLVELPDKQLLQEKFLAAIRISRERLAAKEK
jgi:predicted nuclease of restriction endonuclease-like (RecB) superfamily